MDSHYFSKAQHYIPGGVNSPVRAFKGVGGEPIFIQSAKGAVLTDVDGKQYIDYVGSWGPMILGHAHDQVIASVIDTAKQGLSFGAPTQLETQLAAKICHLFPSIDKVRMVSSGTEATMSAIRLARGYTGRNKIIKFIGCYHGHSDSLLAQAGSGILTLGIPSSAGVPDLAIQDTLLAPFNCLDHVQRLFEDFDDIAAVIIEPIAGNMSCLPPAPGFLQGLRQLCDQYQSLLIFDEVMTGFRVAPNGAQGLYGITPDLTTLGKIIGGGMPVGAFGGREEIMDYLAPIGPVYQAGTLSGNPVTMAAGLTTLTLLQQPDFYEKLFQTTEQLVMGLISRANDAGIDLTHHYVCGMFGLFFTDKPTIENYQQVMSCDQEKFKTFFHGMLAQGIYLAPSAFEAGFVSSAHGADEIEKTLLAAETVFRKMSN